MKNWTPKEINILKQNYNKISNETLCKMLPNKKKAGIKMINRVVLMGRICQDLELKTTPNGVSVTSFRIAVERSYVKSGEERKADFFDIVCWRNTADFVCKYFGKGSLIAVEGQLQSRTYQAKDGSNRYVVEVVADGVSFTGEKREQAIPNNNVPVVDAPQYSNDGFVEMPSDDDLPF